MQQQQREERQQQDDDNDLYSSSQPHNNQKPAYSSQQGLNANIPANSPLQSQGEIDDQKEEQDQAKEQQEGFQIIGKQSDNQAILIKLHTDNLFWHRGVVLFGSAQPKNRADVEDYAKNFLEGIGLMDSTPKMLLNTTPSMQYYIISKQQPLNGKILVLFQKTYRENFFINMKHLLTINYDSTQYNIKTHPELKSLKQISPHNSQVNPLEQYRVGNKPAQKAPIPLFITLQSTKDMPIIQKLLGYGESLYLPNAQVLALGENVRVKWDSKARLMKYTGPGYVFFEPKSKMRRILSVRYRQMVLANFVLVIFIIALYMIEAYFLK